MKHAKQILCLLLTLMMVFSLSLTAFATETPHTETVTNETDHTYHAFQVFSGSQTQDLASLGDVQWGSGVKGADLLAALKADARLGVGDANIFAKCETAADVAEVLAPKVNGSMEARYFANIADLHRTNTYTEIPAKATNVEIEIGYWLLVDVTALGNNSEDALNHALLQVTNKGGFKIEKKYGVPTVDKTVTDSDGTIGTVADYSIGDDVPFTLTGTLPSNYLAFEKYYYQFNDTLSKGLDYISKEEATTAEDQPKVMMVTPEEERAARVAYSQDVTEYFTFLDVKQGDGTTKLTITCENLNKIKEETPEAQITRLTTFTVTYKAKLTADAQTGSAGNSNKVFLAFSNNPNGSGEGRSKTPEKEVLVFTYVLDNTKVDGQNNNVTLKDAEFILKDHTQTKVAKYANGKVVDWTDDADITKNPDGTYPAEYTLKSGTDGKFTATGLDSGLYYLCETKAPAGYNKPTTPTQIRITSTFDKTALPGSLTRLTIKVGDSAEKDGNLETGTVSTTIENGAGSVLPTTGGIGTTIFYVVGSILLIGAAVLLITKKRMNASK